MMLEWWVLEIDINSDLYGNLKWTSWTVVCFSEPPLLFSFLPYICLNGRKMNNCSLSTFYNRFLVFFDKCIFISTKDAPYNILVSVTGIWSIPFLGKKKKKMWALARVSHFWECQFSILYPILFGKWQFITKKDSARYREILLMGWLKFKFSTGCSKYRNFQYKKTTQSIFQDYQQNVLCIITI